jgi:anthranilate synthase component 1
MRQSGAECFLLESVEGGEAIARYTFLGCEPVARLTISGATTEEERGGKLRAVKGGALRALERLAVRPGFQEDPELPPLSAGAVGFLGYDAVRIFEDIPDRIRAREGFRLFSSTRSSLSTTRGSASSS